MPMRFLIVTNSKELSLKFAVCLSPTKFFGLFNVIVLVFGSANLRLAGEYGGALSWLESQIRA